MSNLLKSKEIDTTPVGNRPTTIIQKVIEICESGATANRTGAEFGHIMRHQNSVFVYNGQPAACVAEENGVFSFAVLDASGEAPVLHTYTVDNKRNITQGADISFGGGGGSSAVTEKTIEVEFDNEVAGKSNSGIIFSSGSDCYLIGDQTAEGGLLHNARVTGIDFYVDAYEMWLNGYMMISSAVTPIMPTIPVVYEADGSVYTFVFCSQEQAIELTGASKMKIHYYEVTADA